MRLWPFAPLVLSALAYSAEASAQHDFDPSGRRAGARVTGTPRGHRHGSSSPETKKKPNTEELIERYTKALLANPTSAFPLQKLTELYRTRDGNLDKQVLDFEVRASGASGDDQVNARLALAGIYLAAVRRPDAVRMLDELARSHPALAAPQLMRAALAESDGDHATARRNFEAALPLLHDASERERVTRQLMILALDMKDLGSATTRHEELVRLSGGSIFVQKELATELMTRGQYAAAEVKLREVVRATVGDNRALAPVLKDLGEALARQKKLDEALVVLERARVSATGQAGIRNEIIAILTEVYREQGKLVELVAILEKEGGLDAGRLLTLGQLLEETGQVERAIARYREAIAVDRGNVEARVRVVHLLQTAGQLDEAIRESEALTKAAPDNAEYVFELADTWLQRGERDKALGLLQELERRAADKGDVLASIADFYERMTEPARALKVFERLATMPDGDPRYLVDLGDRYYQTGERDRGIATWKRLLTVTPLRADGLVSLGEVYLEHDLTKEGLEALREAVKLAPADKTWRYRKALAGALERSAGAERLGGALGSQSFYREAIELWQQLHATAGDDVLLARECRNHLVGLWVLLRELEPHVRPLKALFAGASPNLEAGRLLAEVERRLGRYDAAEGTLRRVIQLAPGDTTSMLALERLFVVQRKLALAIDILAKLVDADPKRAREHYQRMSQYASELYRDDDAVAYAARSLELSPEDAEGHVRLAALHRRRQENDRAMRELRTAIIKNPKLYTAYFDLAELALQAGDVEEAGRLYRQVVRSTRDEEFVVRAVRLSMQLHLGAGTLETLEHELLPVTLGNPQKTVYRRMLVEVYKNLTAPLVQAAHSANASVASEARAKLLAVGTRAVKPLLDALADTAVAQQRVAIEVLGYVQNKGAGPALFNFATGTAEVDLRVRAMVACGALADPALLPRYQEFLAPKGSESVASANDPVSIAATWGVAAMGDPNAVPLLLTLVQRASGDVRALAALGLGLSKQPEHSLPLATLARAPDAGPVVRAAATLALGELGDPASRLVLVGLAESSEADVRLAALSGLARLEGVPEARREKQKLPLAQPVSRISSEFARLLARSILSEDARVRRLALAAATAVTVGEYRRQGTKLSPNDPQMTVDFAMSLLTPAGYTREEESRAVEALRVPLVEAAESAVRASAEQAEIVGRLLLGQLPEFARPAVSSSEEPLVERRVSAVLDAIGEATVGGFVLLTAHPVLEVRRNAAEVLAERPESAAGAALVLVLESRDGILCRSILAILKRPVGAGLIGAVMKLTEVGPDWILRLHAVEALGRSEPEDSVVAAAIDVRLMAIAEADRVALVREAALRAAFGRHAEMAPALARRMSEKDGEPSLRAFALELLRSAPKGASTP